MIDYTGGGGDIGPRVCELSGPWTLQKQVEHACVGRGEGPTLGSTPFCFVVSRESEGMEATLGKVASSHSGHTAARSGCQ
jgi:hypothetical protein